MPRLYQIETVPAGAGTPQNCLPYGQPLDVRLTLDLRDVRVPDDTQFNYRAPIYCKSLEGHPRRVVSDETWLDALRQIMLPLAHELQHHRPHRLYSGWLASSEISFT